MDTQQVDTQQVDVVVVGAGPVGLVAACELVRRGVRIRVIDKLTTPSTESRAIAVHARSLDMFDRMGIVDDLVATGVKSTGMTLSSNDRELIHVGLSGVDSAFPYSLLTPQTETERVLGERLAALGGIVDRGVELLGLTQRDDGVELTLRRSDGSEEAISASWVIGADGAHSTVRHLVGAKLAGSFKGERFILGDCDADYDMDHETMHTVFAPDGPVIVMPMRHDRVRLMAEIHDAPGTPLNLHPTQSELQQILDERVGGIRITKSHWLTCFEIHHGQVPAYRYGRVFLTGDAAHIHSPAGGQGMNTGMQDAFNLVWKLAATIRGDAGPRLLDSYEAERYPVAKHVIEFSGGLTKVGTLRGGPRIVRNALVKAVGKVPGISDKMASVVEEVKIAYPDSPAVLSTGPRGTKVTAGQHFAHIADAPLQKLLRTACSATEHTVITVATSTPAPAAGPAGHVQVLIAADGTPVDGYDAVVPDPHGLAAKRLGLRHGGQVVVRPDGYVGAVTALDDAHGVANYFALLAQ